MLIKYIYIYIYCRTVYGIVQNAYWTVYVPIKKKKASGNGQIVVMKLLWLFVVPMNDYLIKGPFGLNLLLLKLKTKNWKHCSKIIFKCVNSVVTPIFNIFKCVNSALQYVNSACTVHKQWILSLKVNNRGLNKKKKKKRKHAFVNADAQSKLHLCLSFIILF